MSKVTIPAGYKTPLSTYEMQRAIEFIKSNFQVNLGQALNLRRVSAPLFVEENSGLNDNLNGVERPVSFDIPDVGAQGQVVHSLAKWKRLALKRYDFKPGKGLFTDMNAIRRDEEVDNLHSVYVDQWDWEKVIERRDRNVAYLEQTVRAIVGAVVETNDALQIAFPSLHTKLDREVFFVTTQELEDRWPDYTPKQREDAICKEHHTVFLMQIGDDLKRSGKPHDGRAPDYDDWSLNGDILMYNPVLDRAFEISSMGIRVDEAAMDYQLHKRGCDDRRELPFHKMLLAGHRRRHRPEPSVYADDRHLPHRRSAGQPVGQGDHGSLRKGRRHDPVNPERKSQQKRTAARRSFYHKSAPLCGALLLSYSCGSGFFSSSSNRCSSAIISSKAAKSALSTASWAARNCSANAVFMFR